MPTDPNTRKERKGYEIADDPEWVIKNKIPIDYVYYFDHKFRKPVVSVMRFFLMEDMIARIKARTKQEVVTIKELTEETDQFLFNTVSKGCVYRNKPQLRYFKLRDGKVATPLADRTNKNSIAFYSKQKKQTVDSFMKKRGLTDKQEAKKCLTIEYEDECVKTYTQYKEAYKTRQSLERKCRACLKHTDESKSIDCGNTDCKVYVPRVESVGIEESLVEKMQTQIQELLDIEDLI